MREVKKFCPVTVIIPKGSDAQLLGFLDQVGVPYEFLPFHRNIKPAVGLPGKIKLHRDKLRMEAALLKFLEKYDLENSVLHIELAPWQSLRALKALCGRSSRSGGSVQVFVTMHNRIVTGSGIRRSLWKYKLNAIAKFDNFHILASNKDARESLRSLAPAGLVDDIKITYTSINPPEIDEILSSEFDRAGLCQKFDIAPDKFTVLCVGQFIDRKGRWTFLEAAQKIIKDHAGIQFLWISNSKPSESDLKNIETFGLGDSFRLITNDRIGNNRQDLLRMYRLADAFVLASFVEGLPIALLEAMALKIPSISTNINGIPEAIKDMETGLLIEAGDSDALAGAILKLKNDPELRTRLAESGRSIVLREFDEREAAKTALAAYIEAFKN